MSDSQTTCQEAKKKYEAGVLALALDSGTYNPCVKCGMPYARHCMCTFCGEKSPHVKI